MNIEMALEMAGATNALEKTDPHEDIASAQSTL